MSNYALAQEILGQDFISPEEIISFYVQKSRYGGIDPTKHPEIKTLLEEEIDSFKKTIYSEEVLEMFSKTLPSKEVLEWGRDNDCILLPGPNHPLSINGIYNGHFGIRLNVNFLSPNKFGYLDTVEAKWYMIRKKGFPNSELKTFKKQKKLLSEVDVILNAPEFVWGLIVYKMVRDVYLFNSYFSYARTSSVYPDGNSVIVGIHMNLPEWSLDFLDFPDNDYERIVGIATCRKL